MLLHTMKYAYNIV